MSAPPPKEMVQIFLDFNNMMSDNNAEFRPMTQTQAYLDLPDLSQDAVKAKFIKDNNKESAVDDNVRLSDPDVADATCLLENSPDVSAINSPPHFDSDGRVLGVVGESLKKIPAAEKPQVEETPLQRGMTILMWS